MSEQIFVPIPSLVVILSAKESEKGSPLTEQEVREIAKNCVGIMMDLEDAEQFQQGRGDISIENCWEEWQIARTEFFE
ncbi:MAG: hypothetical protein Q4B95_00220 [Lonepinella koalarum]|nr:hypothetical protein [Lonepinella koalarum]